MHLILTHEQADFDAIGAMLGAALMNERAIPVLPRRLNRNVRAFLNLYGTELPFIEARDLPAGPVQSITLVDTQSLITLKGVTSKTEVQVVDHHPLREDLPPQWTTSLDASGACTTLFVEGLREHNGPLSPIHATLMLLGIYEDTGSLSYGGVTPRDIRAAATLVEMGASLKLAARYLNPPLSLEQRMLYDVLLQAAETHTIHGERIVVACADAREMNDEISSIAHKLRDLLDPDGIFLIARTSEGVRIVARSSTDRVDVAGVALHFGGGGHGRAAAALVKFPAGGEPEDPLAYVHDELLQVAPRFISRALNVSMMMSRNPLVLSPNTSAQDASRLMQRYGYEGYPVAEAGQVVGLLTRRAVDRALSHRLNLTAASLMEAGNISVQPDDTVETLRRVMGSTGWGQVPVVDPADNQIVGIVTRTDLLKTLSEDLILPGRQNLSAQLESAMPPARLALLQAVAALAREEHAAVYIVGGFVRDLILNRPGLDFDVVVEGDAIALARRLSQTYGGRLVTHARFGTAKWSIQDVRAEIAALIQPGASIQPQDLPDSLDLISARTEFYDYPTALPTVERSSIKLDLHRRDFTINTLALRLDGRHYGDLYDYWGGLRDLRQGVVRVLHSLSFVDDPTRLLRAVRFEQRFSFKIETRTEQLMREAASLVRQVSGDRLRHEIDLIFDETHTLRMLERLQSLGVFEAIHPQFAWSGELAPALTAALTAPLPPQWKLPEKIGGQPTRRALAWLIWLLRIESEPAGGIAERLHLSGALQEALARARQLHIALAGLAPDSPPSAVVHALDGAPLVSIYAHYLQSAVPGQREWIERYIHTWRSIQPFADGNTLKQRGLPPGALYRTLLVRLRSAWLDGEIHNQEEENRLLEELLKP